MITTRLFKNRKPEIGAEVPAEAVAVHQAAIHQLAVRAETAEAVAAAADAADAAEVVRK
jgi:hypothetical protein